MATRGYNIAALAARTGITADTLRKWEQRYGILRPTRTPGGQRRYDEQDVARVEWLKARLHEGFRIGEAAALLGGARGGTSPATTEDLRRAVVAAAAEPDPDALARLLDHAFALGETEMILREVVQPVLREVGELWESGAFSVAQEHLVTGAVRARLERLLADARGSIRGVAVLACAPGEQHELGLMMLAVLLRADGWQVAYLGADTPLADAIELATTIDAKLLCVSASMPERLADLDEALHHVEIPSGTRLVLGGGAVDDETARRFGALHADGDVARTVQALRELAE